MAKFTRIAYASGSLRTIVEGIAHQAGLDAVDSGAIHTLHGRKARGRKRVRITIEVRSEVASQRTSGPARRRPVQAVLPLELISDDIHGLEAATT